MVWDLQRQPRAFRSEGSWTGPRASSSCSSPVLLLLAPLADSWRLKGGIPSQITSKHTHIYIHTLSLSPYLFSLALPLSPLFSSSCCCSPHALSDEHRTPSRPKQFGTSSNGSSYFCSFPRRTTEVTLGSRPSRPGGEEEGNILPTVSLPRSSPAAHAPLAEGTYTSA